MRLLILNSAKNKGTLQISNVKITQQSTIGRADHWKTPIWPQAPLGDNLSLWQQPPHWACLSLVPSSSEWKKIFIKQQCDRIIHTATTSWVLLCDIIISATQAAYSCFPEMWHTEDKTGYTQFYHLVNRKLHPISSCLAGDESMVTDTSVCN